MSKDGWGGPEPVDLSSKLATRHAPDPTWPHPDTPGMAEWKRGVKGYETHRPRKGDWMLTSTGRAYWPMDPRAEDVSIEDIAHSLSMQCRYGGHSARFYSVAEHSVMVSRHVLPEDALAGLMHDASEAYVTDVPRPLKPHLENFREVELMNWIAICEAFELNPELPESVHTADLRICHDEMLTFMPTSPLPLNLPTPFGCRLDGWDPLTAKANFLRRFDYLWNARLSARYPAALRTA